MKTKKLTIALAITGGMIAGGVFTLATITSAAPSLAKKLAGRFLLQVEEKGELWYVDPVTFTRSQIRNPQECFNLVKEKKLGITNSNINQIPLANTTKIKIFFTSNKDSNDCTNVIEFMRTIPATQAVGSASLNEMLKGPTMAEGEVATNVIPYGTKLLSLNIENQTAYADFSKELQNYGGGSCTVEAIRAQIEQTLKQFQTVKNVVISVEGETDWILQP